MNSHNPSSRADDPFVDNSPEDSHQLLSNTNTSSSAPQYTTPEEDLSDATPVNPVDFTSPSTPPPIIPRWTPDSPSAAHPNLPAPPVFDAQPSRARAWSNDSAASASQPLNQNAAPFADSDPSAAGRGAGRPSVEQHYAGYAAASGRPGTSDGASTHSPPARKGWRSKPKGFFVLGGGGKKQQGAVAPGYLEAGRPTSRGKDGKVIASEDLAVRRRRRQKVKLGALAGGLCLLFLLLIGLAVGVGIGVVHA